MSEHELWNELGNLYYLSGSFDQAIYAYNRSIQMERRFGRPYSNLALTYVRRGKYAEAVKLYQTGIELLVENKEKAISWYRLGDVYRCLKDYRDAILAYQQGDMLDPTLSQDSEELGEVLYGPSELTSAPELSRVGAAAQDQPITTSSASDSSEAAAPSADLVGSHSNLPIEPELAVAEEVTPTLEEPQSLLVAASPVLEPQAGEATSIVEDPSVTPLDDDLLSLLFEEEPEEQIEEEEPGDWLFYFGSNNSESAITHTDPNVFSSEKIVEKAPVPDPVPMMQDSPGYPSMPARENQLQTVTRIDFQNISVAETKETPPLILAIATDRENCTSAMEEEPAAVLAEQEPIVEPSEVVPTETELEIEKVKHVLEEDPDNAMAWQTLGDLLKSTKMYKEAIHAYQQSVSIDPKNIDYRHRLGICYAAEGRVEEAIRTFQEVLRLNPGHGLTHATLGGYYRKMGLEELADKHLTIAMKNIYDSENEYNRACLQALCGNFDEAVSLLKVALETKQTFVDWVLRDPDLDGIRSDPRFKQLISQFA